MDNMQPGQVIVPRDPSPPSDNASQPLSTTPQPQVITGMESTTNPPATPGEAENVVGQTQAPSDNAVDAKLNSHEADWRYSANSGDETTTLPDEITWTASEFIAHEKSAMWYALLGFGGIVATGIIYFLTKDKITSGIILIALVTFGIFAARKPRSQQYSLGVQGLQIGAKSYAFQDFKAFSISEESEIVSILFMPLKRFMPPLTIYVAPSMEDQVVEYLSLCLPLEKHQPDALDSLLRRIHF